MVTKQQQLEWLAKHWVNWDALSGFITMSDKDIGSNGWNITITREEWQQERDKMQKQQDNSWYERGEFPPAGTECEAEYDTGRCEWNKARVIGVDSGECFLRWIDGRGKSSVSNYDDPECFRPLLTEREKAIDEMIAAIDHIKEGNFQTFIGALYDAGYRKQ